MAPNSNSNCFRHRRSGKRAGKVIHAGTSNQASLLFKTVNTAEKPRLPAPVGWHPATATAIHCAQNVAVAVCGDSPAVICILKIDPYQRRSGHRAT